MRTKKIVLSLVALLLFVSVPLPTAAVTPYEGYNYSYYGYAVPSPSGYLPSVSYNGNALGVGSFNQPNDLFVAPSGHIYILDSGNKRIVHLDENWNVVRTIDSFDNNGITDGFSAPSGIFVTNAGIIYVADTEKRRVVILSEEGRLIRTIENPQSDILPSDFTFYPLKLTVDYADRVYVVARGVFEGIMQFDEKGEFLGYVGTNKVRPGFGDYIWKLLATREQRERMVLFIPSEFSGVDIDERGFVYATNVDPGSNEPVKRLNPSGEDILKRHGYFGVIGDVQYDELGANRGPSRFIDITVHGTGMYSVLDAQRGRIFTYDDEGKLLYVFGGVGNQLGVFRTPVALTYVGDRIAVLDRGRNRIVVFEPTAFGQAVNSAIGMQAEGKVEEAVRHWREALRLNANFEIAYIGIGKAYLMERRNKEAMEYFKLGMNRKYYSTAFKRYRKDVVREHFGTAMNVLLLLVIGFAGYRTFKKYRSRRVRTNETISG
ncbi:gluconolactonase [Paenibacillus tarimensis]